MKNDVLYFYCFIFWLLVRFNIILTALFVFIISSYNIYCETFFYCKKNVKKWQKNDFLKIIKNHVILHDKISHFFDVFHAKNTTQKLKKPCKKKLFYQHPIQKLYSLIYSKLFRVSKVTRYTANAFFLRDGGSWGVYFLSCVKYYIVKRL